MIFAAMRRRRANSALLLGPQLGQLHILQGPGLVSLVSRFANQFGLGQSQSRAFPSEPMSVELRFDAGVLDRMRLVAGLSGDPVGEPL